MAHGLPDYYRGVDIAYQALSEMIVRPKYGGAIGSSGSGLVAANSLTTLLSISGKGMIYGGYVWLQHTSTQKNSYVQLEIDGQVVAGDSFLTLNGIGADKPRACPIPILKYDDTGFTYCVGFAYGVTFESTLKVQYDENHGDTFSVDYNLVYALI